MSGTNVTCKQCGYEFPTFLKTDRDCCKDCYQSNRKGRERRHLEQEEKESTDSANNLPYVNSPFLRSFQVSNSDNKNKYSPNMDELEKIADSIFINARFNNNNINNNINNNNINTPRSFNHRRNIYINVGFCQSNFR